MRKDQVPLLKDQAKVAPVETGRRRPDIVACGSSSGLQVDAKPARKSG
jgi:hypothetical protein